MRLRDQTLMLLGLSLVVVSLGLLVRPGYGGSTEPKTVKVCHHEPGYPSYIRIIEVPQSDLDDYLARGDTPVMPEVCNGVDDDCDGVIDNNLGDLGQCTVGTGVCVKTGARACVSGVIVCTVEVDPACEACQSCRPQGGGNSEAAHFCQEHFRECGYNNVGQCVSDAAHNDFVVPGSCCNTSCSP
jgi:hypothetical protein